MTESKRITARVLLKDKAEQRQCEKDYKDFGAWEFVELPPESGDHYGNGYYINAIRTGDKYITCIDCRYMKEYTFDKAVDKFLLDYYGAERVECIYKGGQMHVCDICFYEAICNRKYEPTMDSDGAIGSECSKGPAAEIEKALEEKRKKRDWLDYLPADVLERLGNCVTPRRDLPALVNAKWAWYKATGKDKEGYTKEDALVEILDICDCNGRDFGADMTRAEYDALKEE